MPGRASGLDELRVREAFHAMGNMFTFLIVCKRTIVVHRHERSTSISTAIGSREKRLTIAVERYVEHEALRRKSNSRCHMPQELKL
jgi:hypothetical protein